LWHTFEVASTEKEVAFENAFNVKGKILCLKNELRQAQMQAQ
jgi:hypothetical protein